MATVVFSAWGLADGASAMEPVPASPEDRSAVQTEHEHIDPNAEGLDRFIVTFAGDSRSSEDRDRAVDVAEKAVGTSADVVRETADGSVVVATEQKLDPKESAEFMEKLAQSDTVDYVEPDALVTIADERTGEAPKDDDDKLADPNDTMYSSLWGLHGQWGAHVPDAWKTAQGKDTTVAVLDTGITKHPDLEANLIPGYDFISREEAARDGNGRDADPQDEGDWFGPRECGDNDRKAKSSWHGTHVAGTIAAVGNNEQGVIGVAPEAKIQPVRVLGKCGGSTSDIADAIVWASGGDVPGVPKNQTPAQVINMSLGGRHQCGRAAQNAIDGAVARGTTVVVSAGNSKADAAEFFPASCKNVVTVAASDSHGKIAPYSNFGNVVDVAAPGGDTRERGGGILSTLNTGATTPEEPTYVSYQGTSMAAPHVSGAAALLKSVDPGLTPARIEEVLKEKAVPLDQSCEGVCGAGLINAAASVAAVAPVEATPDPAPAPTPTPTPTPDPVESKPSTVKPTWRQWWKNNWKAFQGNRHWHRRG
jgi:serine protease